MPAVIISRSVPFKRGDMSIQLYADRKQIGALIADNSLRIELPAGGHELQAVSNGIRGKRVQLNLSPGEVYHLQVEPIRIKKHQWWEVVILLIIFICPTPEGTLFGIDSWLVFLTFYGMLAIAFAFWQLRQMRGLLRLEPTDKETAGLAAV